MIDKIAKMLGTNQNQVSDVFNKAKSMPQTKEAFIDLINKNGGVSQLKKAEQMLNNPAVAMALKGMNVDTKQIKSAINEIKGTSANKSNNSFTDRLKKMK